jgi:hypothetical protein
VRSSDSPETPRKVPNFQVRFADWDQGRGTHQGQRHNTIAATKGRTQDGTDQPAITAFGLAKQEPSTEEQLDEMSPYARWAFKVMLGGKYGGAQQAMFEIYLRELHARVADQLWNAGFDALVQSTLNDSHVPADFDHSFQSFSIEGVEMPQTFFASLSLPWNILNTYPVVAVPSGLNRAEHAGRHPDRRQAL